MPWKTFSLLEARQRFVRAALRGFKPLAQLCREAHISLKTGFKWLRRFRTDGRPGLRDRSRQPHSSPQRTPARWLAAIRVLRRKHPRWGGRKIYARLRQFHPRARLPKPRTITDWVRRWHGKSARPRVRPGPKRPRPNLSVPHAPNDVWTVDFKGWFRTHDGQRVNPLTVRDLFSRFVLGIRLLPLAHGPVQQYFQGLFRRHGQPKVIRVDHGAPFAGDGPLDLSRLSAWWLRLGIQVEFTRRSCPQDNGAHEQMHRIYKADTAAPPASTPKAQQRRSNRWVYYYNHHRPHEALGQRLPAGLYHGSRRRYRGPLPPLRYRRGWKMRRVSPRGFIHWRGRARGVGRAFAGENIGLKPVRKGEHEVYFGNYLIGVLVDTDAGAMRPARWSKSKPLSRQP
jgi:transposase InsO family protein